MTPDDRRLLAFEARNLQGVRKHGAIIKELGMTPARYVQRMNRLLSTREALELEPMVVHRWERQRDLAAGRRSARSFS